MTLTENIVFQNFILLFGAEPGVGVPADTKMVEDIMNTLTTKVDKMKFTVELPSVLDDMQGRDTALEMITSSPLQPLKLHFCHNLVIKTFALVFVGSNYRGRVIEDFVKKAKAARQLFEGPLKFDKVRFHTDLSKGGVLE